MQYLVADEPLNIKLKYKISAWGGANFMLALAIKIYYIDFIKSIIVYSY